MSKLPFNLDSIVQHVSKLQLRGGLSGKICHVVIYVALSMAAISWSVRSQTIAIIALAMIFVLAFMALWRLINLAHKSPQSALMEGAEFLLHEQMMIGRKDAPEILLKSEDVVESAPLNLDPNEIPKLNQPDQEPPPALGHKAGGTK